MSPNPYVMLLLSLVSEIAADYCFKVWSLNNKPWTLVAGVALYGLATVFFAFSLRGTSMTKMWCMYTLVNIVAAVAIGVYFGDPFPLRTKLGVALSVLAILVLA